MNFLYLLKYPLVQREYDRHGIGYMLDKGHQVTVMDLSKIIHPELEPLETFSSNHLNLTVHHTNTWREMEKLEQDFARCDLAFLLIQAHGLAQDNYPVIRMFSRMGTPYLIQAPTLLPGWDMPSSEVSTTQRGRHVWGRLRGANPVNSIISRISPSLLGLPHAKYIVYANQQKRRRLNLVGPKTKVIEAHTYDFDDFIQLPKREVTEKAQAVFIDQFMPFHEDYKAIDARPIDPDAYYSTLRGLFDRVERELGLNVVIAAHPYADYSNHPDWFGGRPLFVRETKRLIAESQLSLLHSSTIVGYAILLRKPVMLLATRPIYNRHVNEKRYFDGLAKEIGTPLRFIDTPEETDLVNALDVDEDRYERFLSNFMRCPHASDQPYWEIVFDAVRGSVKKNSDHAG